MTTLSEPADEKQRLVAQLGEPNDAKLAEIAASVHPADVAEVLDTIEDPQLQLRLFRVLTAEQGSEVMRQVADRTRTVLHEHLSDARLAAIVEQLDTDDATDLVSELPEHRQRTLLHRTSPETRRDVEELLAYHPDTAGGIMKTEVAVVPSALTVREIRDYIRGRGEEFHDVQRIFVTGEQERLVGYIPLRGLILAADDTPASTVMHRDVVSVHTDVDQEEVAHLFEKYDMPSLPVVDSSSRVVGSITIDDIIDVIEEEATEDILRLAGVAREGLGVTTPIAAIRSRLPWLGFNLLTASISAATIALFEGTIRSIAIAAALMTIVASQGGNAGVQTLTLVVRGLAIGEIETRHFLRILGRECLVAVANGAALGLVAGIGVYAWQRDAALAIVLGSAMVLNLMIAAILGSLVPLGLKWLRVDPAVASSVFVTAGTDILGFLLFLGLLTLML
jgi:magnesium transporter